MKKYFWFVAGALVLAALIIFVFVPAFAGSITIDPTISLGIFNLHLYGVVLGAAILSAYFLARKQSWRFGLGVDVVDRFAFWLILFSFLGARIYYVLFNLDYYSAHLNEIWQVWKGGISIFGAIISGAVFSYFYSRKKAYTVWQILDLTALVLPVGQAIGRLGNFINYEAFGGPTNLPWKMFIPLDNRPEKYLNEMFFHPTFLYELLANGLVFILLIKLRKKLKSGQLAFLYLLFYSLIRFLLEFVRLDVFYVSGMNGNQIIAGVLFIIGVTGLIWKNR